MTATTDAAPDAVDVDAIAQLVARSRAAQGLPPQVTDAATLARVAALVAPTVPPAGDR